MGRVGTAVGDRNGQCITQAGNKKFLATRWAVWKSFLERVEKENQPSPKLGPVRSQLKSSVVQKGCTGLQGGVHGGTRLEQLLQVEKSLPWELRALKDLVDALLCFIPRLSGIPGAPGESSGRSVFRWEGVFLLCNELP